MTSMIPPRIYATQLATQAHDRLAQASTLVRSAQQNPADNLVGIPEHNGPDSPDNPFFGGGRMSIAPNSAVARLAGGAVTAIDAALKLGPQLSTGVTTAFQRAKQEALTGVKLLETPSPLPVAKDGVALNFDAAALWLNMAKNLMALEGGQPAPGTIQLPSPDSPIQ